MSRQWTPRTPRVPELEMAWAAGLFEGEGTITLGVRKQDWTFRLMVTVSNTDRSVIDFFQTRWQGWVQPAYGARPGRRPAWNWTLIGWRAEEFLAELLPHVRTDRVLRKLELGLRFRDIQMTRHVTRQGKAASKVAQRDLYDAMRRLNRRGRQEQAA